MDRKEAREKAKELEQVDMAEVWRNYSQNVQKHLEKNRRTRAQSRENPHYYL